MKPLSKLAIGIAFVLIPAAAGWVTVLAQAPGPGREEIGRASCRERV